MLFPFVESLDHFPIGEANPGVRGPEGFWPHFNPGKIGSSAFLSGDGSEVCSPKLNPRSGVEPRLEVPASAGGVLGVRVLLLSSLALPCKSTVEGESLSSKSDN